jgi:hypothetical protein
LRRRRGEKEKGDAKINLISVFFRHTFVKKIDGKIAADWIRQRFTKIQPA